MCYNVKEVAREWTTRSASLVHHHEKPVEEMYKTLILVPVSMQEYVDPGVSIFLLRYNMMLYQKEINTREIDPFEYLRNTSCSRVGACCNSVFCFCERSFQIWTR